jgi:hypothetical protein
MSLTTQDVRSWAHGLVCDLLREPDESDWTAVADRYFRCFDRGKPRRPTRLQRLYLEWSRDREWTGLLEACQSHPNLWEQLKEALSYLDANHQERRLLSLVLTVRESEDWSLWLGAFAQGDLDREDLLKMLPWLPVPSLEQRLGWLSEQASGLLSPWSAALLPACRLPAHVQGQSMPESLIALTLQLAASRPGEVDPCWLAALRGYRWPREKVRALVAALHPQDPVHRIVYGPRPGRPWLAEILEALPEQLNAELPSAATSP